MARRHGSATHAAQAGGGAYLMLYNRSTAEVERMFVAGSPELAEWCAWGLHSCQLGCLCRDCGIARSTVAHAPLPRWPRLPTHRPRCPMQVPAATCCLPRRRLRLRLRH